MKKSVLKFDKNALAKVMFDNLVEEQTRRLIEYAKTIIIEIGDKIQTYHSANNMDRTGNLLDSLCWGVSYQGKLVGFGFYREQKATSLSYLHEWFRLESEPVGGHVLANNFIKQMGNLAYSGWRVFFAILAPYWGYWEEGFTFRPRGDRNKSRYLRFSVMTQFYDRVSKDLSPAKMKFTCKAPEYSYSDLDKQRDKRDTRAGKGRKGRSVYDKYPRGKGKGKYDY